MVQRCRLSALLLLFTSSLAAPAIAAAQGDVDPSIENEARSLFEAGRQAYDGARYEPALRYFEEAYELSGRPGLLFNIGAAADRLQQGERALEAYRRYLEEAPDAPNRAAVLRRIAFFEGLSDGVDDDDDHVASPSEAAASVTTGDGPSDEAPSDDIASQWWFWTLIAAIAVGAGVGITVGVLAASPSNEPPLAGDFPATMALRFQ